MSDENKILNDIHAAVNEVREEELRKAALAKKKLALEEKRVQYQLDQENKREVQQVRAEAMNYGVPTQEYCNKLQKDNMDYMDAATQSMTFINSSVIDFKKAVPYFRKNLIFIGAKTGEGKSTAVANIVLQTIFQVDPVTGKNRRCLVISNEEKAEDFYNRVTCLMKGIAYTNHDQFTPEMKQMLHDMIPKLMGGGRLMVIDDSFGSIGGTTTTVEGIKAIFDDLIRRQDWFDVIIIDYYQNVNSSRRNPMANQYAVQEEFANLMDQYKNLYPAPIVVMGQVKPPDLQETPFEVRVKGSKAISVKATVTIEMIADRKMRRTLWCVWKSRFTDSVGLNFYTGFEKGRFVPYTDEFKQKALAAAERQDERKWNKQAGQDLAEKIINKGTEHGKEEALEKAGIKGEEVVLGEKDYKKID